MTTPKYDLPTAIRIGAKIRPQCRGLYYIDGGSCVLGAMAEAEGVNNPYGLWLDSLWPELTVDMGADRTLRSMLVFLNDSALWTREEIADWLDVILP